MIDTKKVIECANAQLEGSDIFVVDCKCSLSNEVELLIDSDTKVSIDKCIELSRMIDSQFDRDIEDFSLTVASAGIGSELKDMRQFKKLVGSSVEVLLLDGVKITAKLVELDEQGMGLEYDERVEVLTSAGKKKKVMQTTSRRVEFEEVKYTKEYLDFK
ncbi:MAG: ribosome assembly cofactor RimP [Rikenellaceae bacterium]